MTTPEASGGSRCGRGREVVVLALLTRQPEGRLRAVALETHIYTVSHPRSDVSRVSLGSI